jgi:hypothetical protein
MVGISIAQPPMNSANACEYSNPSWADFRRGVVCDAVATISDEAKVAAEESRSAVQHPDA